MATRVAKTTAYVASLIATAAIGATPALAGGTQAHGARMQAITPTPLLNHQLKLAVRSLGIGGHDLSSALVSSQTALASGPAGFDWSAAAVGALAAAAVCVMAIGVVLNLYDKSYNRPKGGQP
jgi:hypothetical protein